jgi:hypothetical protein
MEANCVEGMEMHSQIFKPNICFESNFKPFSHVYTVGLFPQTLHMPLFSLQTFRILYQ